MHIKVYETVPNRDRVLRAVLFGLEYISLTPSPYLDMDKIDIRVYSLGHPTSKGTSTLIKKRAVISIFTCMCADMEDICRVIFHELTHLKQFSSKPMVKIAGVEDPDEVEADLKAEIMLREFLELEAKRALQA